ncbi:MAG: hypothetical protein KatS3mg105_4778 [Gemmatales bacterium]|nr:MAG: hypothetical protein KatS3mg105_4778 [Gemmatales bacterium]
MARLLTEGTEIVPGFRLVKLLGRGGFGEVWRATAPGGTEAAIKLINLGQQLGHKELQAIRIVKQIRHPHLVPIVAYWLVTEDGEVLDEVGDSQIMCRGQELDLVIAMGLGDKNLLDRLNECRAAGRSGIPAEELINYIEDAARAIDYLNQPVHDLGDGGRAIQHCDIKPQNILIVGGAVQVCDFGLARVLGDSRVTSAKGSAAYIAPELLSQNKPSHATDQYSLAITYVELRTGKVPVDLSSPAAAIWSHIEGKLKLEHLPPAEREVIRKATAIDPHQRFSSALEMARALRQAIEGVHEPSQTFRALKANEVVKEGMEIVPGYRLLRLLGQGGYGQVWEAMAPGGMRTALKIIRNLEGSHGRQEFKALELIKSVEHNHLIELYAYWLIDAEGNIISDDIRHEPDAPQPSTLVIASRLASKNLLQRLAECQKDGLAGIPPRELIRYMKQAAEAVDYLNSPRHRWGNREVAIQHRDIKPENILLAAGVVKVGDFGLAKVLEGSSAVIHGDSAGLTLSYAAPELFTNRVTHTSDQYSLALTYYKLRTGEWPFPPGARPNDIIRCHMQGTLELGRLPESERRVIARATAWNPEERFPSCLMMVAELYKALQQEDSSVEFSPLTRLGQTSSEKQTPSGSSDATPQNRAR